MPEEKKEAKMKNKLDDMHIHVFSCPICGSGCHFFVKDKEQSDILGTVDNTLTCGVCGDEMIMDEVFLPKEKHKICCPICGKCAKLKENYSKWRILVSCILYHLKPWNWKSSDCRR